MKGDRVMDIGYISVLVMGICIGIAFENMGNIIIVGSMLGIGITLLIISLKLKSKFKTIETHLKGMDV